jgi:hypothetical protein
MATMVVGGFYKHRVFCYSGDQLGLNTRYFKVASGAGTAQTEAAFVLALDTLIAPLYITCLYNSAQYVGSDIQNISAGPPFPIQTGTSANTAFGTGGAAPMGAQVSGIYSVRTGLTGRGARGRVYVPFPPSNASSIGPPPVQSNAYQAKLLLISAVMVGTLTIVVGGTTYSIVWGLLSGGGYEGTSKFIPTTIGVAGTAWATQKRRGDFGRTNPFPLP